MKDFEQMLQSEIDACDERAKFHRRHMDDAIDALRRNRRLRAQLSDELAAQNRKQSA